MERLIPLIGYNKAETTDSYAQSEERDNDSRIRHWALVWWDPKDSEGRRTAEICVVTEGMPDFCGGLMVYSPRVDIYHEIGAWNSNFCMTANTGLQEDELSFQWENFDTETDAIDLAAWTGKEDWNDDEVVSFAYRSIAGCIAAQAAAYCKRGIMGADKVGGRMSTLWDVMSTMDRFAVNSAYKANVSNIMDEGMRARDVLSHDCTVLSVATQWGDEWRNANSGNMCWWLTAEVRPVTDGGYEGDDDGMMTCEECGTYHSAGEECPECGYLDDGAVKTYCFPDTDRYSSNAIIIGSVKYRLRARRHFWRNG
jgi:hypothetical protein